jgi:hypothetical protein
MKRSDYIRKKLTQNQRMIGAIIKENRILSNDLQAIDAGLKLDLEMRVELKGLKKPSLPLTSK